MIDLPKLTPMRIPNLHKVPGYSTIEPIDYTSIKKYKVVFSDEVDENYMKQLDVFVAGMNAKEQSIQEYVANRFTTKECAENDQFIGKKSEFFAMHFMDQNYGFPIIPIDLEIRKKGKKGWAHDLPYKQHYDVLPNFHVKACSKKTLEVTKRKQSWTFQQWDKSIFHRNTLEYEYGIFVYLHDLMAKEATIWIILPIHEVKTFLREPILDKYKDSKTCFYSEEFDEIEDSAEIYHVG